MKIPDKIIIYDDDCPLCAAYTSAFVKTGILDEQGRKNFSNIDASIFELIDKKRCNNEIPLFDTQTKELWYGVDALLELLNTKLPFIKFVGNIKPIKWVLQKCYKFISYNRKVIVATHSENSYDSSPDFNISYRIYFLIFFLIFNTLMLQPLYAEVFSNSFIGNSSFLELQLAHIFFVAINVLVAIFMGKKNGLEYLGQVNMLALISVLLLLPLCMANRIYHNLSTTINSIYLFLVVYFIIRDYIRRMKYATLFKNYPVIILLNIISLLVFIIYLVK